MSMKTGTLLYNEAKEQFEFCRSIDDKMFPLLTGEKFDVKLNGKWFPTQIEKNSSWHLVGLALDYDLSGLIIRLNM